MAHFEYADNVFNIHNTFYTSHKQLITNICTYLNAADKIDEVESMFLDVNMKPRKPKRDPHRPRKNKSAYMFFCSVQRKEIDTTNLSCIDVAKKLGGIWRELDDKEKEKYKKMADEDKSRYADEMKVYNNKLFVTHA